MRTYFEKGREIPVKGEFDVVVCGGGPAGTAAAIAAAKAGVKTLLIESEGCLGGIWTCGELPWVIDCENKTGIMKMIGDEIISRNKGFKARGNALAADAEEMKLILEDMCVKAGVKIRLHTFAAATVKDQGDNLKYVITESKSGREAWAAKVFTDCTGDGDIGALSGCGFDMGKPGTGETQPMSLIALVTGLDQEAVREFNNSLPYNGEVNAKKLLLREMKSKGISPSYAAPSLFHIRDDMFIFMTNQEYNVFGTDADDITAATINARREIHEIVNALKDSGGIWKNMRIAATAEKIGVREGRRLRGLYKVTAEDLIKGAQHEDSVCRVTFGFDLHSVSLSSEDMPVEKTGLSAKHYDIPMGAIIAKDVKGLLMAGRCISGDFLAHSSYRVTGDAAALGESAGLLAAAAVKNGLDTHSVKYSHFLKERSGIKR